MTKNLAASIHQKLLNHARANDRPFNEVLQYFALERFLYRLGRSPFRQQFVLKGALMLTAWQSPYARPTRDIDLLGRTDNAVEHIVSTFQTICRELAPEDGLVFDADSVLVSQSSKRQTMPECVYVSPPTLAKRVSLCKSTLDLGTL